MFETNYIMPQSCAIVIFGASGDLTARKIMPALYKLHSSGRMPESFHVVGFARSDFSDDDFRTLLFQKMKDNTHLSAEMLSDWDGFKDKISYVTGDYSKPEEYRSLAKTLESIEPANGKPQNRLFYFAVPDNVVGSIIQNLLKCGLIRHRIPTEEKASGYNRIVLEKPFGHDLESACDLNSTLHKRLEETQIYRMDHYLGKETVQNIMVLRFANSIFEPVWNNRYINQVRIMVAESDGVASRAKYFDSAGALRDVLQNHVLQLLALFAMEPPTSLKPGAIRMEKAKVLEALAPLSKEELENSVLRGQYGKGRINDQSVRAYRDEEGVRPNSNTETYVSVRSHINNWRWSGVPFYLTTGKRLRHKMTDIVVEFKPVPHRLFSRQNCGTSDPNILRIQVQPEEKVAMRITSKVPGLEMKLAAVDMDLPYSARFGGQSPEAYERLILDAMTGNNSLFASNEEIELAWAYINPILDDWERRPQPAFPNYSAGTWGPRIEN